MSRPTRFPRNALPAVAGVAAVVAITGACSSSDSASPDQSAPALERGAEVYETSCASCHGADLQGTDKGPSHLSIVYEPNHHTDESFRSAIANGAPQHHWTFGDMKPIEGLNAEDVDSVIAFIRSEQERQGFER